MNAREVRRVVAFAFMITVVLFPGENSWAGCCCSGPEGTLPCPCSWSGSFACPDQSPGSSGTDWATQTQRRAAEQRRQEEERRERARRRAEEEREDDTRREMLRRAATKRAERQRSERETQDRRRLDAGRGETAVELKGGDSGALEIKDLEPGRDASLLRQALEELSRSRRLLTKIRKRVGEMR